MKQVIRYSMIGALCIGLFACSAPKQEDNNLEIIPIEAAFASEKCVMYAWKHRIVA